MNAVAHLASLLARSQTTADPAGFSVAPAIEGLDALIASLEKRVSAGSVCREPVDLQREVIQRFWTTRRVETLRDARLIAFGLGLAAGPGGASVLDDKGRLEVLLQAADGWTRNPRWFRRCYQGLVWSYFNVACDDDLASPGSNANWTRLRDYLHRRLPSALEAQGNPDWVKTLDAHRCLFGVSPCQDFVGPLLRGERGGLEALCEQFGIGESSWFLRDLVQAQVLAATSQSHDGFGGLLPAMLQMLAGGSAWRDAGTALLLERYAKIPQAPIHEELRDATVKAWGSPWKPIDALRWEGISEPARKLIGDWQKAYLIDHFFAPLGEAGARRAAFWKRYIHSIGAIELALGRDAADAAPLRGLVTPWQVGSPGGAALVLTIGRARFVTFDDPTEGVWAYDLRNAAPFHMGEPVAFRLDAPNSLRHSARDICLSHWDGVDGWRQWEQLFESTLRERFGIRVGVPNAVPAYFVDLSDGLATSTLPTGDPLASGPVPTWCSAPNGEDVHWQTAEAMSVPYSRPDLEVLARVHALTLKEGIAGKNRVRVGAEGVEGRIARVLDRWGFTQADDGDWCR